MFGKLKSVIKDHEFKLRGKLKESFTEIIGQHPIFKNGHKGTEMTNALRKRMEDSKA